MDFSKLPDCVFLKIFRNLPFKDRVRAGGVNKRFDHVSKMAVAETKVLAIIPSDFNARFTPQDLARLLTLCGENLEEIRFRLFYGHHYEMSLLQTFGGFHFPKMKILECNCGEETILNQLLNSCPNLKSCSINEYIKFPNILTENLETLECRCENDGFQSMIGRVPNLKNFTVDAIIDDHHNQPPPSVISLAQFLDTVPHLETLRITTVGPNGLHLLEPPPPGEPIMEPFWRLKHLTVLKIGGNQVKERSTSGDSVLIRMAKSFPLLQVLVLPIASAITDLGLSALSALHLLRKLSLECKFQGNPKDLSDGVRALMNCEWLRKLRFPNRYPGYSVTVSPYVLAELFQRCPQLSQVGFWNLAMVNSTDAAAAMTRLLAIAASVGKKKEILIKFYTLKSHALGIWRSDAVKNALEQSKEETGVTIEISID